MAGEWNSVPFEQLLAEPVRNGLYKSKEFHGRGAKIVNMGELFAYPRLRSVPMKRIELSDSETSRFALEEGDLIFARRSLTAQGAGKCSVVLEIDEPTTFESSIIRARPNQKKALPLYLYYYFNSPLGFHSLDTIRRQVAVAGITGSDLAKLEIPVPPISEQRAIAHVLGTLDDKIELNRRMNETLEAIARAMFKSWFVDFDPVRAQMNGEPPESICRRLGLTSDLLDLFPDRLVDSELGEIPEGWEVKPLSFLASVKGGKQLDKVDFSDSGKNPVFGGAGIMGRTDASNADGAVITVGRVGAYCGQFFWYEGPAWVNNNSSRILANDQRDSLWIYLWLKNVDMEPIKKGLRSLSFQMVTLRSCWQLFRILSCANSFPS